MSTCVNTGSFTALKGMATVEKELRSGARTHGLGSNAAFQPCEPPFRPRVQQHTEALPPSTSGSRAHAHAAY